MTDTPLPPDVALARLRQYGERTTAWSTATYNNGTERALHQIAVSLASEVERLRATQVAQLLARAAIWESQQAVARPLRPDACKVCGDIPDEWCPDCACCKAGCDGGRDNNPCTHPNTTWNKEPALCEEFRQDGECSCPVQHTVS
ncbi:hypothetical protein ACFU67_13160 [Streptomyces rhizosphaericola]|uniref:hypothetical protein n=1 Tax=Streptomyces rhizosphaericola TaxID=2564098 RepID=UPI003674B735